MDEIEPIGTVGTTITMEHIQAAMERLKREPTETERLERMVLGQALAAEFRRVSERDPDEALRLFVLMNCDG